MHITDRAAAHACLERIGYYRLSGYWYPFRQSRTVKDAPTGKMIKTVDSEFRSDTTFQQVMDLYAFDKRLRLLVLDAIERIEVALRVDIALVLGAKDPWAHRQPNYLHGNFSKKVNRVSGKTAHAEWLERIDAAYQRSKEEFVKHFKRKYQGEPPIWIAVELWDFGAVSFMLDGMQVADQLQVAKKYGLPRIELLTSWARSINHIRNVCAHHSRLWNRSPADQAAPPKPGELSVLDHVATDPNAKARIYLTVAVIQFLLKTVNPTTTWSSRLHQLVSGFPEGNGIRIAQAGFPDKWHDQPLWK